MRVRRGNPILSSVSLSGSPEQEISVKSKLLDLIVKRQISGLGYSRFALSIILMRSATIDLAIFWYGSTGNRRNTRAEFGRQTTNQSKVVVVELLD
jgi:hypothetical protein